MVPFFWRWSTLANITIKDLPDTIHEQLKAAARAQGSSLNGYVISVLETAVDERAHRKLMREGREEYRRFVASLPRLEDSAALLREARGSGARR